jgi:hypothetical protein
MDFASVIDFVNYLMGLGLWNFIGALALFYVIIMTWKEKRDLRKRLLSLDKCESLSKRPIAIVIGIGKDPTESVKSFLADNKWADVPIISWVSEGFLKAEEYQTAMAQINSLRKQALKLGVSEVLLFYAGPVDLSFFVGASYDNWVPVQVFTFVGGSYDYRFTLEREAARIETASEKIRREV